jgi:hypothetical protein
MDLQNTNQNTGADATNSTVYDSTGIQYPVDTEHLGIRVALPTIMLLSGLFVWVTLAAPVDVAIVNVIGIDGLGGLGSAFLGTGTAILAGIAADRLLKRYWPSGRTLRVSEAVVALDDTRRGHADQITIRRDHRMNLMLWRFPVKRSTPKAPAGWLMLAVQLQQDELELTVYTFMPPKQAKKLRFYEEFTTILPPKQLQKAKLSVRETAEQRRIAKAEANRWENGAELRPNDFMTLIEEHLAGPISALHQNTRS